MSSSWDVLVLFEDKNSSDRWQPVETLTPEGSDDAHIIDRCSIQHNGRLGPAPLQLRWLLQLLRRARLPIPRLHRPLPRHLVGAVRRL
jgi:hypothetical protein